MSSESAPALIDCAATARERIRDHVDGELEREVGGFLAGHLDDGRPRVEVAIPALRAEGHRANVTFTHDVWDDALAYLDREHPDLQLVGWYHSHPGFGIFLSEYDQFIHRNFFPAEGMAALVIDPHTGADGWFITRDGDITRTDSDEPVGIPSDLPTAPPTSASDRSSAGTSRVPRGTLVLLGAAALLAGFVGGWLVGDVNSVSDTPSDELLEARLQQEELAADLRAARQRAEEAERRAEERASEIEGGPSEQTTEGSPPQAGPSVSTGGDEVLLTYRVRPGDTLSELATALAADPEDYLQRLVEANPQLDNPDLITVGSEVRLPLP